MKRQTNIQKLLLLRKYMCNTNISISEDRERRRRRMRMNTRSVSDDSTRKSRVQGD